MSTLIAPLENERSIEHSSKSRFNDNLNNLSNIFDDDVNISIWKRELDSHTISSADQILDKNSQLKISKVIQPQDVNKYLIDQLNSNISMYFVFGDIANLVEKFCNLFHLKYAWLRLDAIDQQMCPRFHADNVKCRLVTTYIGPGTEWLPSHLLDRSKLGSGSNGLSDLDSGLFSKKSDIQRLSIGDVALLKGKAWKGNEKSGLVHRSPYEPGTYRRLYLTIDFSDIFTDIDM